MQSPPPSASARRRGQRLARGGAACQRCRRRKQKCDLKYPCCSNCEGANSPCLIYDSSKQAEVPRDYVAHLESQIDRLTQELQELRTHNLVSFAGEGDATPIDIASSTLSVDVHSPTKSSTTGHKGSSQFEDLVTSVRTVVAEPSRQPRFLGQSGGITLAKLVMASIRADALPSPLFPEEQGQRTFDVATPIPAAAASLPPRHAANHLVDVYFQYRTPHLPIISRSQVEDALESAYSMTSEHQPPDRNAEKNIFTTYMVLAIALCDLPSPSGNGRPSQSEGCFGSAVNWIEKVITYSKSDIDTLRTILLLSQFVALCPSRGSLWHLTGTALRLCIDIGLHWETEEQAVGMDSNLLNERRRLWYSTYQFDRLLCITLGRPFGIIDESARVPLPNPWMASLDPINTETNDFDIHSQRAHNHLFDMSKLESEIKHVHHSLSWATKKAYPKPNYTTWLLDIQPRLQQWYATIPERSRAHPSSIFANQDYWDAIYNNAIILLHRPKSTVLHVSNDAVSISFEASCKLIRNIKMLQREGKVDIMWKYVHHLFMAGLGVIYSIWQFKEVRDRNPVRSSISTLQSCATTLTAMSECFHGASSCRDVFEALSSATIDWLLTNDADEVRQNRLDFEKQVQDLLQQLQPSRDGVFVANDIGNDGMSGMLSVDNFAFGEMLNSAAQWPFLDYMGFGDLGDEGYGSMQTAGFGPGSESLRMA
ncbi:fungal-specific transcription factor domain-containing protein [Rhexocercosporidium sp. MPI-PUGE-AT-0058]|nr:fungal-specific transcription factor domain-containing protein [Rhexocercosporidium sp. MPI-PUGE-AT-0058]